MSYDESDAAYDEFVEKLFEEFRDNALDDTDLYDRIVDNFRTARLYEYYLDHPGVAEIPKAVLDEARQLVESYPRASLVLAVSAIEIGLRDALLSPILHGSFHTSAAADLIVSLVVMVKNERVAKALVGLLAKHTGIDLRAYSRPAAAKPLWEEIADVQKIRNRIIHMGNRASVSEARHAIVVAESLLGPVLLQVLKVFELHLHAGTHVCGTKACGPVPGA